MQECQVAGFACYGLKAGKKGRFEAESLKSKPQWLKPSLISLALYRG
jgi:hypothetical protein